MVTVLAEVRALRIHLEWVELHCTNGPSKPAAFTTFTITMAGKPGLMMTSSHVGSTTLARGSSGETCSGRCEALGRTTLGRGGGATNPRFTPLSSCSPIMRVLLWR